MKKRIWAAVLAAALLIGGTLALGRSGFFEAASSLEGMRAYIARFTPRAHLVFFLVQLASVIVAPIPSNVTALAGAVLFGTWMSFLLTASAMVLGSMLVFGLARTLGQSFAGRFIGSRISARYLDVIQRKRDLFLALAFLFPFFPDDLLCILAGLTNIKARRFFVLVVLTRPWGLLAACVLGGAALALPPWVLALLGLAGAAVFVLVLRYGDRWERMLLEKLKRN